jgi:hypothetical protein
VDTKESISNNLEKIRENIKRAAEKSGRTEKDILLLGVTKTIDTDRIKELVELGVNELGENKVQEILSKYDIIGSGVQWHLIGRLQTNKVKYIIDKVKLIHSVDSVKLLEEIDKRAKAANKVMDILIEVNVGNEETKGGICYDDVDSFVEKATEFDNIKVKGFMTVAPFVENPEENRKYFKKMNKLFVDNSKKINHNISMEYLSMGMTNDYEVAIEEGANIVRIGTGIFGKRNYNL